ncbi:MAG: hypothetical protein ACM3XN_05210 [Chloroflexota bacterium]
MERMPVDTFVRTMVLAGYTLDSANADEGYVELEFHRNDRFGVLIPYDFVLYGAISKASVDAISRQCAADGRIAVFVGPPTGDVTANHMTFDEAMCRLGGPANSWIALTPNLGTVLHELGCGRVPDGLDGTADALFEGMVKASLQYLLGNRVLGYGHERLFEAVPDGLAIYGTGPAALYDCKAYSKGYSVSSDDVRRFSDYVSDFNNRYRGRIEVSHFIVVTGEFLDSPTSLQARERELRSKCGAQLTVVTASDLGTMVNLIAKVPTYRGSVNWSLLLSGNRVFPKDLERDLERIRRDGVMEE